MQHSNKNAGNDKASKGPVTPNSRVDEVFNDEDETAEEMVDIGSNATHQPPESAGDKKHPPFGDAELYEQRSGEESPTDKDRKKKHQPKV